MYLAINSGLGGEAMGPPRDPSQPVEAPDVQQQIADVWAYLFEGPGAPVAAAPRESIAPTFTETLNANAGKVALGAGALLLVLALAKGGR